MLLSFSNSVAVAAEATRNNSATVAAMQCLIPSFIMSSILFLMQCLIPSFISFFNFRWFLFRLQKYTAAKKRVILIY